MGLEVLKKFDKDENRWVVSPIGEIDIYTSEKFKDMLLQLIEEESADITISGDSLEYIDSTGLGVLISIFKKLKENDNTITVTSIKPSIKKLFELTSLDKVFIIKE